MSTDQPSRGRAESPQAHGTHLKAPAPDYLASCLELPFFDPAHAELARQAHQWASRALPAVAAGAADLDAHCVALVKALGEAGLLRYCVPRAWGGALDALDSRSICLLREALGYHDALADFAFAMQGLGSGAIALGGSDDLRRRYLPRVADGQWLAAFALSEPDAGSDVAAMTTRARRDGDALGHRRLQDLDLQRRHRQLLHPLRAHLRRARRPRHQRLRRRCRHAGPADRGAHRRRSRRIRSRRSSSTAAGFLPTACSARKARASSSRWRRSTSSARRWRPRRSGSPGARWRKAWPTPGGARCSARRWRTSR